MHFINFFLFMYNINNKMNIQKNISGFVDNLYDNPYFMSVLKITLILYASRIAPRLSDNIYSLFDSVYVKIFAIFLLIHAAERRDFQLSLLIAFVYVMTLNVASGRRILEPFSDYSPDFKESGNYIEYTSHIYPGCLDVKLADIEKAFSGDALKVQQSLMYIYREFISKLKDDSEKNRIMTVAKSIGLPYNVEYTDRNAPLIATLLMHYGAKINDSCAAPVDDGSTDAVKFA
jgi:hypothetical protein